MTSKKIRQLLSIGFVLSIIFIALSLGMFVINFKSQIISDKISDWASFGDYFGGITNTLISFLSLIVLGVLTYLVNEKSVEDIKKNSLLERKMDAYEILAKHIQNINYALEQLPISITLISNKLTDDEFYITENKNEIYKCFNLINEFNNFLFTFVLRYSHIFDYDFKNINYEKQIELSKKIKEFTKLIRNNLEEEIKSINSEQIKQIENETIEFFDLTLEFINELRNEL